MNVEAEWAYAMDMKKAISEQEGQDKTKKAAGLKNQSLLNKDSPHANRNSFRLKAHARKRL